MLDDEIGVDVHLSLIQQCCPGALWQACNSSHPLEMCSRYLAQVLWSCRKHLCSKYSACGHHWSYCTCVQGAQLCYGPCVSKKCWTKSLSVHVLCRQPGHSKRHRKFCLVLTHLLICRSSCIQVL